MKITKRILINLGEGDFDQGFSKATIKVQEVTRNRPNNLRELECQIPKSLDIPDIYQNWQKNYDARIKFSRTRAGFKNNQLTNVSIPTISDCNQKTEALQDKLNHWLNPVKIQLEQSLELSPEDEFDVVLHTPNIGSEIGSESTPNLLQKLPWHCWDFFAQDNFSDVALSFSNSEQVNLMSSGAEPIFPRPKRVKILCILGEPGDDQHENKIDVEADRRLLRKIPGAYCVFLRQPTRSEFFHFMEKERWDFLFFSGHSKTDKDTGLLKINPEETLDIQEIKQTIQTAINQYQGMKLAIFNSCDGLGLARQLADLDIAQIIIWREPVPDKVAQEFLKSFLGFFTGKNLQEKEDYTSTEGLSLYRSVQKARLEVQNYIEDLQRQKTLPQVSWLPVIHHNLAKESITWKQLRQLPDIDIASNKASPRETLLKRVEKFWIKGVLDKSLHIEETLELGLIEDPSAVINPSSQQGENSSRQTQHLPEGTRAIDVFGELENTRTMLILGRSGSGKTTALLEIADELISDARKNTTLPIPVVLNLSSWAGEKEPKPLAQWLVTELNRIYQFSEKQCKDWVKNQQLLLLLDGLDEVRESKRGDCIRAINQFLGSYTETEMVVCSRIRDYHKISEKLQFKTAVFYRQLTDQQIQRYFDDAGDALSGVKELKEEDEAIQELVKSPLTLNFIAVAYKGQTKDDLNNDLTNDLLDISLFEKRRKHLLDAYIQKKLEEKPVKFSKKISQKWLIWIADQITQRERKELLIERMQPDWLPVGIQQWLYSVGFRVILGLIAGLTTALHFGTQVTDDIGVQISLVIPSVIAAIVSCLSFPVLSHLRTITIPGFRVEFIPQKIQKLSQKLSKFIPGILSGLLYIIITALMVYPMVEEGIKDDK
ncbi:NACHT domain-containing protein, partial [Moorena sp. SIO3B2]|uniref:NACHT domain-containing protein n=1 Tax=Moorena sp. SIO3B2 TaxID=2607827 RepID=UPI0013CB7DB8